MLYGFPIVLGLQASQSYILPKQTKVLHTVKCSAIVTFRHKLKITMQYDPINRLKRHIAHLSSRPSAPSEFIEIMRLTRLAIDKGGVKKSYSTLAMYCDWVMHSELDRNPTAWKLLKRLDDSLLASASSDTSVLVSEISKSVSLAMLRKDFLDLFAKNNIDTALFAVTDNWIMFQQHLLHDLEARPIGFPDDISSSSKAKGREMFDEMLVGRNEKLSGLGPVIQLSITFKSDSEPNRPAGFYWNVRLHHISAPNYVTVIGYLRLDGVEYIQDVDRETS